jgi:hypothetical protein
VLLAVGSIGGLLAVRNLPGAELSSPSFAMQMVEPSSAGDSQSGSDAVLLAIAVSGGVGMAVYANRNRGASSRSRNRLRQRPSARGLHQASSHLRRKLLRLLHDDQAAAVRLFNHAQMKYPDRSTNWCVEKIIYDLERDRNRAW